jgi:hypothetical protein
MISIRRTDLLKGDYCTWFPDRIFGVDIGLACYDHDAAYDIREYSWKVKGDVALLKDVWTLGAREKGWKNTVIKGTALLMFSAVSTIGNLFWLRNKYYGNHKSN